MRPAMLLAILVVLTAATISVYALTGTTETVADAQDAGEPAVGESRCSSCDARKQRLKDAIAESRENDETAVDTE